MAIWRTCSAGRFRLRGVPFLRGEPLVVEVGAPSLRYPLAQEVALPSHPADRTELEFVLPVSGIIEVRAGETATRVLREPRGGAIDVREGQVAALTLVLR